MYIKTMRIKFLLLIVLPLSIALATNSFAEDNNSPAQTGEQQTIIEDYLDQQSPDATEQSITREQDLKQEETVSDDAPAKIVTAIEIKGNKNISTNTIFSKVKTRIGSPYQENVISDDLKRLYLLGFFSDIKINTQEHKDGVKVIFTVTERPIISKITFSGITRITMKDEKLKEQLKSRETQYLDYPNLAEDVKTFEKMYEKMGFGQAKIDPKVDIDSQTNRCTIEFKVTEGARFSIRDILVEGNKAFPSKRILNLLKTKRAWLFNAGVLKDEVLKEDIERVKSFYQKNGYADVAVEYDVTTDPKKPYIYIHIKVTEGQKYLVGNITITGTKDIPEKLVISKLNACTPGKVFSQDALRQDVANIQGVYFDRGYIACQVQETSALNPQTKRVDIAYNIVENQVSYVNKIKVRGNIKTKDIVIRREMKINPGERFDGDKLRRSKEKLQNLGYFEDISYDTTDTEEVNKKDLIVDVKESKTGSFSFGGGYSTVDSFVGFVEVEQKNFDWKNWPYFTGAGQNLRFRASFGTISSGYDLSFTEPWLFDYPVSAGFDAYQRQHSRDSDVGYGYDEKVTGGALRLGKEITDYIRGDISYRFDNIRISNIDPSAASDLQSEVGTNKISSVTFGLTFDSRNNIFDTTKGDLFTGTLENAGGPFGGDKNFAKAFFRLSHYFPLIRGSALELRGRLGAAKPYGATKGSIPIYERFFAGGAYTIRGYDERTVGPVDPITGDPLGGEAMIVGNIEYVYPLFSFLKGAIFFDTGNVWQKFGDMGKGGYKSGFGLGVRMKTPIGPIMLDYGFPMNKEPGKDTKRSGGKLHFSASNSF